VQDVGAVIRRPFRNIQLMPLTSDGFECIAILASVAELLNSAVLTGVDAGGEEFLRGSAFVACVQQGNPWIDADGEQFLFSAKSIREAPIASAVWGDFQIQPATVAVDLFFRAVRFCSGYACRTRQSTPSCIPGADGSIINSGYRACFSVQVERPALKSRIS
jgi:hypothetical protein